MPPAGLQRTDQPGSGWRGTTARTPPLPWPQTSYVVVPEVVPEQPSTKNHQPKIRIFIFSTPMVGAPVTTPAASRTATTCLGRKGRFVWLEAIGTWPVGAERSEMVMKHILPAVGVRDRRADGVAGSGVCVLECLSDLTWETHKTFGCPQTSAGRCGSRSLG